MILCSLFVKSLNYDKAQSLSSKYPSSKILKKSNINSFSLKSYPDFYNFRYYLYFSKFKSIYAFHFFLMQPKSYFLEGARETFCGLIFLLILTELLQFLLRYYSFLLLWNSYKIPSSSIFSSLPDILMQLLRFSTVLSS